ncbi:MAG TPA: hypothetical protein PKL83_00560 [bacterium]|nr:hypothetical protein [bacterium]
MSTEYLLERLGRLRDESNRDEQLQGFEVLEKRCQKEGTVALLLEAVATLREVHPEEDLLNFWYYRLKIYTKEQPAGAGQEKSNLLQQLQQRASRKRNLLTAAVLYGGAVGSVLWYWVVHASNSLSTSVTFSGIWTIFFGGLWLFLLSVLRPRQSGLPWIATSAGLYAAVLIFMHAIRSMRGEGAFYQHLTTVMLGLLMIGCVVFFSRSQDIRKIGSGFRKFISLLIEISAVAGLFAIVWNIIIGLGLGLLGIIQVSFSGDTIAFLFIVPWMIGGYSALVLSYHCDTPLLEQHVMLDSKNLFSWLAYYLTYLISGFLCIYLLILAPSKFNLIFDTGSTVPLFCLIILVIQTCLFFSLVHQHDPQERLPKKDQTVFSLLISEMIILSLIALEALRLRIEQYAFTADRYIAGILLVVQLVVSISLLIFCVPSVLRGASGERIRSRFYTLQFVGVLALIACFTMISTVINLDIFSARSQIHRVRASEEITVRLDRDHFSKLPVVAAKMLMESYASGSDQFKADVALTLYEMAEDWERDAVEAREIRTMMQTLSKQETSRQWEAFWRYVLDDREAVYTYRYGSEDPVCSERVASILDVSSTDARQFCTSYSFRY